MVKASRSGFSLIEIMVVVVIIGLLAGVVAVGVTQHLRKAQIKTAALTINNFKSALESYWLDHGHYPSTSEGLSVLLKDRGKYLKSTDIPLDPWGNAYAYNSPGEHLDYDIASYGPDGARGGDDDIVSWTANGTSDAR